MSEQADTEPRPQPRGRGRQTVGDMVRSLAAVLVLVGVLIAYNVVQQPDPAVRYVEYPAALTNAQPSVDYDLAGPEPLPAGWRATSARVGTDRDTVTWHLGMVTANRSYAAVEQSDGPRERLVERHVAGAERAGEVDVAGVTWQRLRGGDPEPRALLRAEAGVVTMVAGTASWQDLRTLAEALD